MAWGQDSSGSSRMSTPPWSCAPCLEWCPAPCTRYPLTSSLCITTRSRCVVEPQCWVTSGATWRRGDLGKCRAELENRGSWNCSTKMSSQMLRWPGQGMTTFPAHPLLLTLKPSALGSSWTGSVTPICQIGKGRVGNAEKPAHSHTEKSGGISGLMACAMHLQPFLRAIARAPAVNR